jgi:hypothetical protein
MRTYVNTTNMMKWYLSLCNKLSAIVLRNYSFECFMNDWRQNSHCNFTPRVLYIFGTLVASPPWVVYSCKNTKTNSHLSKLSSSIKNVPKKVVPKMKMPNTLHVPVSNPLACYNNWIHSEYCQNTKHAPDHVHMSKCLITLHVPNPLTIYNYRPVCPTKRRPLELKQLHLQRFSFSWVKHTTESLKLRTWHIDGSLKLCSVLWTTNIPLKTTFQHTVNVSANVQS